VLTGRQLLYHFKTFTIFTQLKSKKATAMDDFLYIILGLLWVVFSFYNKKQKADRKRAAAPRPQGGTSKPGPTPRSIFEEILMGGEVLSKPAEIILEPEEPAKEMPYKSLYETNNENTTPVEVQSLESIADEVPAGYFEAEYAMRSAMPVGGQSDDKGVEKSVLYDENDEHPAFDLREAVIYAEILTPRYI